MEDVELKHIDKKRQPFICVQCKGTIIRRRSHLWDEELQGFRCQDCWYLLIDGKGYRKRI